jgi:hypothetical protein
MTEAAEFATNCHTKKVSTAVKEKEAYLLTELC